MTTASTAASATPGPWFVGCQNDALYIVAGRPPALNNDYPWHDAPRVALAKVYGPSEGDCLPVHADANARVLGAAHELLEVLLELFQRDNGIQTMLAGNPNAVAELEQRARAAIAKALGS